jgi:hypothetical protein
MSATPLNEPHAAPPQATQLSPDEFAALDREDVQAGKLIGRLLAFFFLYTVVVTILAAWWTWDAIRS